MTWKSIQEYAGLYEVSDRGQVRSLDRSVHTGIKNIKSRIVKGKVLKQNRKKNGYMTVDLCKDGAVKTVLVHRLVADAFVPNPNGSHFVNHIDSNRANNAANNLEWVTSSENRTHGIKSGYVVFRQTRKVICVETGKTFEQAKMAALWLSETHPERINGSLTVAAQNIRGSCNGRTPKAYGFTWKYL